MLENISALIHAKKLGRGNAESKKEMGEVFLQLKRDLVKDPVIELPDFETPLVVEGDAYEREVGAVLAQNKKEGLINQVKYVSRTIRDA